MRKIIKIEPTEPVLPRRKRVAAYARVSMECERLMHSMSAQISYYSELIQKNGSTQVFMLIILYQEQRPRNGRSFRE